MKGTLEERFWYKVRKTKRCWLWIGATSNGYGRFYVGEGKKRNGKRHKIIKAAHRVAFKLAGKRLRKDRDLDHLCRVRRCVRHTHLEQVTRSQNILRGKPFNVKRKCKRGHRYTKANVQLEGKKRHCRECIRERRGYVKRYRK